MSSIGGSCQVSCWMRRESPGLPAWSRHAKVHTPGVSPTPIPAVAFPRNSATAGMPVRSGWPPTHGRATNRTWLKSFRWARSGTAHQPVLMRCELVPVPGQPGHEAGRSHRFGQAFHRSEPELVRIGPARGAVDQHRVLRGAGRAIGGRFAGRAW